MMDGSSFRRLDWTDGLFGTLLVRLFDLVQLQIRQARQNGVDRGKAMAWLKWVTDSSGPGWTRGCFAGLAYKALALSACFPTTNGAVYNTASLNPLPACGATAGNSNYSIRHRCQNKARYDQLLRVCLAHLETSRLKLAISSVKASYLNQVPSINLFRDEGEYKCRGFLQVKTIKPPTILSCRLISLLVICRPALPSPNNHKNMPLLPMKIHFSDKIADKFVKRNVTREFLNTWEVTLPSWITLLQLTALPESKPIRHAQLEKAVNALESVINGRPGGVLLPRFGYLQLANFLDALESRIKTQREAWLEPHDRSGDLYITIAYRLYLNAQGLDFSSPKLKNDPSRKRAIGRRWRPYTEPSSLLLIIYSDFAEKSM